MEKANSRKPREHNAAGPASYSGNSGETRVEVKGNADVAYSSQALCRSSTLMPTIVLAWQQL